MAKTKKSIAKRFKITKGKLLLRRHTHQNHFNARDRGDKTREKRGLVRVSGAEERKIKGMLPHS